MLHGAAKRIKMTDPGRIKSSRIAHKGHATRIGKQIEELLEIVDLDDESQIIRLQGYVTNYKQKFENIQS